MQVHSQYEESLRMQNLRKLYQRAIVAPLSRSEYERIWKDYDQFENMINKELVYYL